MIRFSPSGPVDNYNCWGSAIAGSRGYEIVNGVGIDRGSQFDQQLSRDYTPVSTTDAKFGETVLRFADPADPTNSAQHGAVFYGKSQDGTTYVYSKNGWQLKPEVMKLSDLQTKIPEYGGVKGIKPGDSGYYKPN